MTRTLIKRFRTNRRGTDFVVGDIHGEFDALESILAEIKFRPKQDRLFSVGDLVDRGPRSADVVKWLKKPWFNAVAGNHEDMLLKLKGDELEQWLAINGGEWWQSVTEDGRVAILKAIAALPLAIEVMTENGRIGIVHADVPSGLPWKDFLDALKTGEDHVVEYALWSRSRVQGADDTIVSGVDKVFCGHTPLEKASILGNVHLVDTGACFDGRLTVLPLATGIVMTG